MQLCIYITEANAIIYTGNAHYNLTPLLSSMSQPNAHVHSRMFAGRHACFSKLTTCIISHQQGFKNEIFFVERMRLI